MKNTFKQTIYRILSKINDAKNDTKRNLFPSKIKQYSEEYIKYNNELQRIERELDQLNNCVYGKKWDYKYVFLGLNWSHKFDEKIELSNDMVKEVIKTKRKYLRYERSNINKKIREIEKIFNDK